MSEFKFACPVCGQHITCDSTVGGSQMECPTCFRKIVVPHAPKHGNSKLVLSATEAGQRPKTGIVPDETQSIAGSKKFPVAAVTFSIILLALVAGAVPTGSGAYVLARRMGGDAPLVANILTLQVICAALTIPLVVTLSQIFV